ncbi:hypothetical protein [Rhodococcus sp. B50]|uniref:hypothetical protein n=1 Tax=Rhodococcus sp. B50 TaxID=2682847 RepID=UPI001BD3AF37|nr:hypothetical protein [Rhodococcus sp. B50]MBS9373630.1 hypothetical protein [Rhodococcus sp. B50]
MNTANSTVSDLLRMHSRPARAFAVLYAVTCVVLALNTASEAEVRWPIAVAVIVCVAAAYALVAVEGDPLPLRPALAMTVSGAIASAAVLSVLPADPAPHPIELWPFGMSTTVLVFMCVRGRTAFAWCGMGLMLVVAASWSYLTGPGIGYGLGLTITSAGPVLMGTVFGYTIRPLARSIYLLRAQSMRRIAAESAAAAALEERDARLSTLDDSARPLLRKIASDEPLDENERIECGLLEARLRDGLRAPVLQVPVVEQAAAAARRRNVEIVMLDDHAMDTVPSAIRRAVYREVVDALDSVSAGSVTVRVLPPGRAAMVTMLLKGENVRRIEIGRDGRRIGD